MADQVQRPSYEPRVVAFGEPANQAPPAGASPDGASRLAVLVIGAVERVTLAGGGEALPRLGGADTQQRHPWHKFELPDASAAATSPALRSAGGNAAGSTHPVDILVHYRDGSRAQWTLDLPPSKPPGPHAAGELADDASDEQTAVRQLAARGQALVADLEQRQARRAGVFRAGRTGEGLAVPLNALIEIGSEHESGAAGHDLVHAWASRLERAIKQICQAPRTALVHERRVQSASRVRAMDAHCLRWLAHQPGGTTLEKAGTRQQMLAMTRTERVDTHENRTAAMVLRALAAECRRFLSEPAPVSREARAGVKPSQRAAVQSRSSKPNPLPEEKGIPKGRRAANPQANAQARIDSGPEGWVRRLLGVIERARLDSAVPHLAGPGHGGVRPNHVLRHDPRYRLLWHAHLEMRYRERREVEAWRWRHRLWAEQCLLAVAVGLQQQYPASPAGRSCLIFRRRAHQGRLLDPTSALGRWEVGSETEPTSLLLIERRDLPRFRGTSLVPEPLIGMCPDAVLIQRPAGEAGEQSVTRLGIWAQWTPHRPADADRLRQRCERTAHLLQQVGGGQTRGLVLEPLRPGPGHAADPAPQNATGAAAVQSIQSAEVPSRGDASEAGAPEPLHVAADPRGRIPHGRAAASGACHGLALPLPLTQGRSTLRHMLVRLLA